MPRRGQVQKRKIAPDPVYGDKLVAQLTNNILKGGKKSIAERVIYESFDIIKNKTGNDPVDVLKKAVRNVKPLLEVKSRRVGGANYQVPMEVSDKRGVTLALRWISGFSRSRSEKRMCERVAAELTDASNGLGASIKKKEDLRKMAEANRAFAHYRW